MIKISTALISVSDKTGLIPFARGLANLEVKILSTGGTAQLLKEAGLAIREVGEHTGFPEMLDGRVKTLHPTIHGGILAKREAPSHMRAIRLAGILPIDLVVVNLYPFQEAIAKPDCLMEEAMEMVDIGGPSMVRGAAKNHVSVAVVTCVQDYEKVLKELQDNEGCLSLQTRRNLAHQAFCHTARYDGAIADYLGMANREQADKFGTSLHVGYDLIQPLRYGENSHQVASFFREANYQASNFSDFRQLQGKELSYNNLADADAAWQCMSTLHHLSKEQVRAVCVIVKHHNPCGAALSALPAEAYGKALACDPQSAFGGILSFNCEVDEATAKLVADLFAEVILAPSFSSAALKIFSQKTHLRLLCLPPRQRSPHQEMKALSGGMLLQTLDNVCAKREDCRVVTKREPTASQWRDLLFAEALVKHVKSNAIVFCRDEAALGIGAGQMSRVDSAFIATRKAKVSGLSLLESVAASDAFFPFADGLKMLVEAGATAIIQPGGSVRDQEVIAAADVANVAMVMTGLRHFRH